MCLSEREEEMKNGVNKRIIADEQPMVDWSELPVDVLEYITDFLLLPDYYRFGAVCQSWRFGTKAKRRAVSNDLPWLVLGEDEITKKRLFFSLSENKLHYIDIPQLYGHHCCSSSFGWLFTVDKQVDCHLVNPLTKETRDLPPFPSFFKYFKTIVSKDQLMMARKAILSHNPSERTDFTVVILFGAPQRVAFWRPGNPAWIEIESPSGWIADVINFKGNLYAISACNEIMIVDMGANPKMTRLELDIPPYDRNTDTYLVDYNGETLLMLLRVFDIENGCFISTKGIYIVELSLEEGKSYMLEHMDGSSFFVGSTSFAILDPSKFARCETNSVYFASVVEPSFPDETLRNNDIGIYNLLNDEIRHYFPDESGFSPSLTAASTWLVPNAW